MAAKSIPNANVTENTLTEMVASLDVVGEAVKSGWVKKVEEDRSA